MPGPCLISALNQSLFYSWSLWFAYFYLPHVRGLMQYLSKDWFSFFIFFLFKTFSSPRTTERNDRKDSQRDLPSAHPLSDGHDCWGWTRPKLGTTSRSPMWMSGAQELEPFSGASPVAIARSWIWSRAPGIQMPLNYKYVRWWVIETLRCH